MAWGHLFKNKKNPENKEKEEDEMKQHLPQNGSYVEPEFLRKDQLWSWFEVLCLNSVSARLNWEMRTSYLLGSFVTGWGLWSKRSEGRLKLRYSCGDSQAIITISVHSVPVLQSSQGNPLVHWSTRACTDMLSVHPHTHTRWSCSKKNK